MSVVVYADNVLVPCDAAGCGRVSESFKTRERVEPVSLSGGMESRMGFSNDKNNAEIAIGRYSPGMLYDSTAFIFK